jgi:hypothetical protein
VTVEEIPGCPLYYDQNCNQQSHQNKKSEYTKRTEHMEECRCKNLLNVLSSGIKVAAEWQHEWKMDEISVTFTFLTNY